LSDLAKQIAAGEKLTATDVRRYILQKYRLQITKGDASAIRMFLKIVEMMPAGKIDKQNRKLKP